MYREHLTSGAPYVLIALGREGEEAAPAPPPGRRNEGPGRRRAGARLGLRQEANEGGSHAPNLKADDNEPAAGGAGELGIGALLGPAVNLHCVLCMGSAGTATFCPGKQGLQSGRCTKGASPWRQRRLDGGVLIYQI